MSEDYEIDLTIEAVTGTVYDLCVSPFETILGIKTKIQKLEGMYTCTYVISSLGDIRLKALISLCYVSEIF